MDKIKFEKNGQSIPIEDFAFQEAGIREAFFGLLSGFGIAPKDSMILSGCGVSTVDWIEGGVTLGLTYTIQDGFITLNGEVLKVVSHTINVPSNQDVYFSLQTITSHTDPVSVEGGADFYSQEIRRAELITSSAPPIDRLNWNGKRIESVLRNKVYHKAMPMLFNPSLIGEVMADYFDLTTGLGLVGKDYEGWAMLDGKGGRVDWRARFIVGYKPTDYELDASGGSEQVTLSVDQIPEHSHIYDKMNILPQSTTPSTSGGSGQSHINQPTNTSNKGGGQAHENRPPYVVAAWIVRIE